MSKLNQIKNLLSIHKIDGYLIPKNNEFTSEYISETDDRLKYITNFSGSAGFAIILLKKNYLFVDGRYSAQAIKESGNNFKICTFPKEMPFSIIKSKKLKIGYDPKLHTKIFLKRFLGYHYKNSIPILNNLVDKIWVRRKSEAKKKYFLLSKKYSGQDHRRKISVVKSYLRKLSCDSLLVTSCENIAWILNLRGSETQYNPIPFGRLLIKKTGKSVLFCELNKISSQIRKKLKHDIEIYNFDKFDELLIQNSVNLKKIIVDPISCPEFTQDKISNFFKVVQKADPIYHLKSIKNNTEIKNTRQSHLYDGVALSKFIFWLRKMMKKKSIDELSAEKKLLEFRKKNKLFQFLSFPTIAGSGPNGAIIHYRANSKTNRKLSKKELFLIDSGGQYKFGTTDVTRTLSFGKLSSKIKNIYTRVLKGHISVASYTLNKNTYGHQIDKVARKYLNQIKLDYPHGTGHGVGYFLSVHEGPQALSKNNKVKLKNGMILSNEPGYYLKNKFGIRIENLIYINKNKFENLTLVPIEKSLIEKSLLSAQEKRWINNYHKKVYHKLKNYMNTSERVELKDACAILK